MTVNTAIDPTVSRSVPPILPVLQPVKTIHTPIDPVVVFYTPGGSMVVQPDPVT